MESIVNLPVNEKSFEVSIQGTTSKQMFVGKFRCVCSPNLRQRAAAAVLERQLSGDLKTLDEDTMLYHRMIAQLTVRIVAAPDWWLASNSGQELLDINVVFEVWKHCLEAETTWRQAIWGEPEAKKPEVASTSVEETGK